MARRKKSLIDTPEASKLLFLLIGGIAFFIYTKTGSWPIAFAIIFAVIGLWFVWIYKLSQKKKHKLKMSGISTIDTMDGFQFEKHLQLLFEEHGYKARVTKSHGDYGADLVISKEGEVTVVQAKRYTDNVGIKAIQEIIGAVNYYKAIKAMVVTNSYFTQAASELALSSNVELIDRPKLIELLSKFNSEGAKTDPVAIKANVAPVCSKCNQQMVLRNGKHGQFYGCQNFPKCRETRTLQINNEIKLEGK